MKKIISEEEAIKLSTEGKVVTTVMKHKAGPITIIDRQNEYVTEEQAEYTFNAKVIGYEIAI